jgi:hypothetical protein
VQPRVAEPWRSAHDLRPLTPLRDERVDPLHRHYLDAVLSTEAASSTYVLGPDADADEASSEMAQGRKTPEKTKTERHVL